MNTEGSSSHHKELMALKRRPTIEKVDFAHSLDTHKKDGPILHSRPKQFAHFHYEHVDFDCIQAKLDEDVDDDTDLYSIRVEICKRVWVVHRTYEHLTALDKQLHSCVFDRSFSKLIDLEQYRPGSVTEIHSTVALYLEKFSELAITSTFHCGTVLHFFEADNRGNRLVVADDCSAINIPAIAAAHATKSYISQAPDELSLEVGDMVSVIDKPLPQESNWWRGKKTFEVGFFPSECVELIGGSGGSKSADSAANTKPVLLRRGKVITFLRMFFSSRPNRMSLKRNGIVKERVFGCDLGEHLSNHVLNVPQVLHCCCEVIELHGMIDGIYRLSGVSSHIQLLRAKFDDGTIASLLDDEITDLHTTTSVLKMYFRELPNPLITYQLYNSFSRAVDLKGEDRLLRLKTSVARLPPPHYRTAKYLFSHLHRMSVSSDRTGMDSKNLAIVWSPNLMRSDALETGKLSPAEMLHTISIQATIVEAMITNFQYVFGVDDLVPSTDAEGRSSMPVGNHANRLLSLMEAQQRMMSDSPSAPSASPSQVIRNSSPVYRDKDNQSSNGSADSDHDIMPVFHTVIDFTDRSGRESYGSAATSSTGRVSMTVADAPSSRDKSPSRWRSFFHRTRPHSTKSNKKKKGEEGTTGITDSDIGHLTRPSPTSPTTDFGKLKATLSLTNIDVSGNGSCEDLLARPSNTTLEDETEPGLIRSTSHDSFFDPTTQMLPSSSADIPYVVESDEQPVVTPGVVFKPAYTEPNALIKLPQATWKGSLQPSAELYQSHSTLLSAKFSDKSMTRSDYWSSGAASASQTIFRAKVQPAPSTTKSVDQSVLEQSALEQSALEQSALEQSALEQSALEQSANPNFSSLGDSLPMDLFEQEWQRLEMEQCVNQAKQARLSRSYSSAHSTSSSDRHQQRSARRRYTGESNAEENVIGETITEHSVTETSVALESVTGHGITGHGITGHGITGHGITGHGITGHGITGYATTVPSITGHGTPAQSITVQGTTDCDMVTQLNSEGNGETDQHIYANVNPLNVNNSPHSITVPQMTSNVNSKLPLISQSFQSLRMEGKQPHGASTKVPSPILTTNARVPDAQLGPSNIHILPSPGHSVLSNPDFPVYSDGAGQPMSINQSMVAPFHTRTGGAQTHGDPSPSSTPVKSPSHDGSDVGLTDAFSFSINNISLVGVSSSPTNNDHFKGGRANVPSSTQSCPNERTGVSQCTPSNTIFTDGPSSNSSSVTNTEGGAVIPSSLRGNTGYSHNYQSGPATSRAAPISDRPHSVYTNSPPPQMISADTVATISCPNLSLPNSNSHMLSFSSNSKGAGSQNNTVADPKPQPKNTSGVTRSLSYSVPFKMAVVNRRKETDVDTAIASVPLSSTYAYNGRKIARNSDYVNVKLYETDSRRLIKRHHSEGFSDLETEVSMADVDLEPIYANVVFSPFNNGVQANTPGSRSDNVSYSTSPALSSHSSGEHRLRLSSLGTDSISSTEEKAATSISSARQRRRAPVALPRMNSVETRTVVTGSSGAPVTTPHQLTSVVMGSSGAPLTTPHQLTSVVTGSSGAPVTTPHQLTSEELSKCHLQDPSSEYRPADKC